VAKAKERGVIARPEGECARFSMLLQCLVALRVLGSLPRIVLPWALYRWEMLALVAGVTTNFP